MSGRARRTHIKSKNGCQTCRQRRIRCDESRPECLNCVRRQVNCEYASSGSSSGTTTRTSRGGQVSLSPEAVAAQAEVEVLLPQHVMNLMANPPEMPGRTHEVQFLVYHCKEITDAMESNHALLFGFVTSILPEVHKIAASVDYVRDSLCGLSATHLALLTKSSALVYTAYKFRDKALHGLREALSVQSEGSIDAMLAASFILSLQAPESGEFLHTMKGVDLALNEMEQRHAFTNLRALWEAPALDLPARPPPSPAAITLDLASSSLQELRKHVGNNPELVRGVKELYNFVQNLRIAPPGVTANDQIQALHPIRYWMPWMPKSVYLMSERQPLVILFCAHYNMVTVGVEPYLPAASNPFAIARRVEFIERIDLMFENSPEPAPTTTLEASSSRWSAPRKNIYHELMYGPRVFARDYRRRHPNSYYNS